MASPIKHQDFVRDLKRGEVGEEVVEDFIKKEFDIELKRVSTTNRHWDFEITAKKKGPKKIRDFIKKYGNTIEVKYDEAAAKYKRFFIELMFDVDKGVAGAATNCKSDIVVWVIPDGKRKYKLYFFHRPEFLSWLILYILEQTRKPELKTPGISPKARGLPVSIEEAVKGFSFIQSFDFQY